MDPHGLTGGALDRSGTDLTGDFSSRHLDADAFIAAGEFHIALEGWSRHFLRRRGTGGRRRRRRFGARTLSSLCLLLRLAPL